jgi:anthranilate/para-aminobenzoate synthase component I
VADSDPSREFDETEHKLSAMKVALRHASEVMA